MFPGRTGEFIERTYYNNHKYAANERYICTVQFHLSNCAEPRANLSWAGSATGDLADFASFQHEFERIRSILQNPHKILGIGNMCRIMWPNDLTDQIIRYLNSQIKHIQTRRIHFYGLALRLIKKYVPMLEQAGWKVSVDSTKWTRAVTETLKRQHGLNCTKATRDLFFRTYLHELQKRGINVEDSATNVTSNPQQTLPAFF
jgi:hypothetical protein